MYFRVPWKSELATFALHEAVQEVFSRERVRKWLFFDNADTWRTDLGTGNEIIQTIDLQFAPPEGNVLRAVLLVEHFSKIKLAVDIRKQLTLIFNRIVGEAPTNTRSHTGMFPTTEQLAPTVPSLRSMDEWRGLADGNYERVMSEHRAMTHQLRTQATVIGESSKLALGAPFIDQSSAAELMNDYMRGMERRIPVSLSHVGAYTLQCFLAYNDADRPITDYEDAARQVRQITSRLGNQVTPCDTQVVFIYTVYDY